MSGQNDFAALFGRILLAILFVPSGFEGITGFSDSLGYIKSQGVPLPGVAAIIRILIELGAGLMVMIGWKTRWAALAFIVYLVVITPIFHNFWSAPEAEKMMQQINFMKNVGICGAFFLLLAFGPGRFSVDKA
ncbi:MAG TPA: DoxX family protein [Casimicrobiaceae bacterium]|nr:DoxX family protein [Casimicrobiaceae bacterium]